MLKKSSVLKNGIVINLILFLFSLWGSCVFAEIFLRVFPLKDDLYYKELEWNHLGTPDLTKMFNRLYVYDEELGYEKKDVYEQIKNVLRDDPSRYKILVLGDSISQWGKYVDYFDELLETRYHGKIKVVNAGVMGYDTELEYRYLKYRGMDLKPDLVILQFCVNDFRGTPLIIKQEDGSWLALNGNKKIDRWLDPKLMAASKFYEAIALRALWFSSRKKDGSGIVKEPLCKIKKMLAEKNIPLYVVIFPLLEEGEDENNAHGKMIAALRELQLSSQAIDLLPYYSRVPFGTIRKDFIHPNEKGDKIAAEALMEKIGPFLERRLALNKRKAE